MAEKKQIRPRGEENIALLNSAAYIYCRDSKTLKLLKELIVDSAISGSRLAIWHVNKLGGGYSMESAQYFLDGKDVSRMSKDELAAEITARK